MKTTLFLTLMFSFGAASMLCAGTAAAPGPPTKPLVPGLVVTEYPRHASQANEKDNFYVPVEKLGELIGGKYIAETLSPWTWETERNAVAAFHVMQ